MSAFGDVDGFEVIDEGDLIRTMAHGRPFAFLNGVLRLALERDGLEDRVSHIEARYRAEGLPLTWWTGPSSRPLGLDALFTGMGLQAVEDDEGMSIDLEPWPDTLATATAAVPPKLTISEVRDSRDLDDWIGAMAESYGWVDSLKARHMAELYDPELAPRAGRHQFLARLAGRPVAVASLFDVEGLAWVTNIGTVPDARGMGIGAAVTTRTLVMAAEHGHARAWLAASAMGTPVYRRLGFVATGKLNGYRRQAGS
jgi:GNAT superfamily N-acetyltransferase